MIPLKTVEELIIKHSMLEKDLSSGNIDKKLFAEKSKEYSDLNEIIDDAKKKLAIWQVKHLGSVFCIAQNIKHFLGF